MKKGYFVMMALFSLISAVWGAPLLPNHVEIESLTTDLFVKPATVAGYDYDASVGQVYNVYVWLENVTGVRFDSVMVVLYGATTDSIGENLAMDTVLVGSIPAGRHINVAFRVRPMVALGDSLYAHIVYGKDEFGAPIGEQVVDNDIMVWTELPAYLRFDIFALDNTVAPNAPFVTEAQPIRFLIGVINTGEDQIDSVRFSVRRTGGSASATSTILNPTFTLYGIGGGEVRAYYVYVNTDPDVNISTGIYEAFEIDTVGSWVQNTRSRLELVTYADYRDTIRIQQPPQITFPDPAFTDVPWLNAHNSVVIGIPIRNRPAPRAPADRFVQPGYPAKLVLFPSGISTPITGIGGLDEPVEWNNYFWGSTDTFYYEIYNIASSYEGWVDLADTVYFHDQNWPAQTYPVTCPASSFYSGLFRIDIQDPQTSIISPSLLYYNSGTFPETLKLSVTDNLSGVDSVYYIVVDSLGNYWDGTNWTSSYTELVASLLSGVTYYGLLPVLPPDYHGTITITAYAKDVAGNREATPATFFTIIDNVPPIATIFWPESGYWSDSSWTGKIEVEAIDARTGIKSVRVCIKDLNTGLYWDDSYPGAWVSYRKFNNAYRAYGNVWRYNYTPNNDGVYMIYAQAKDFANNVVEDTLDGEIRYDKTPPSSDIDLPLFDYYSAVSWGGYILGNAEDPVVNGVHSWVTRVELAIRDTLTNRYWIPPSGWTSTRYWFVAQIDTVTSDTFGIDEYRYYFTPPAPGHYKAYVRATDFGRLINPAPADSQLFVYDPVPPVVSPVFPMDHGVYSALSWPDTVRVMVVDTVNTWVSSVQFAVYCATTNTYWNWAGDWVGSPVWRQAFSSAGNIWWRRLPAFGDGNYALLVRARDAAGNLTTRIYYYRIGTYISYIVVEAPPVVMVGETFPLTVTAYRAPEVIDTLFSEPLSFTSNMPWPDSISLPASPQYLRYGRGVFEVRANAAMSGLIITVSGTTILPRNSNPIEVIRGVYPPTSYGIYDNPADQGDTLVIHHSLSINDPYSPFADTATAIVTWYKYYRDINPGADTNWVLIDSVAPAMRDSVIYKITNNRTFTSYTYSMIVFGETRGGIHPTPVSSRRVLLGTIAPVDNVPPAIPANFSIERAGDYIRLSWNQVATGVNGTPEINPHENIRYYIYRYTEPYAGPTGYLAISDTTFFYDTNLGGADVVGDTLHNYYWDIRAVDHDGNWSEYTYRVGEIDFLLKTGWTSFGIPFDMGVTPGITRVAQVGALIPSVEAISKYNPGESWIQWNSSFPWFNNYGVYAGDALWAYVRVTDYNFILTIVGKVPAPTDIVYSLHRGNTPWNAIIVPLHRTDLTTASVLASNIPGATSVARWVPVSGSTPAHWEQWIPALPTINNFTIRPGAAYFVAVGSDVIWPSYPRIKANEHGFEGIHQDEDFGGFGSPALVYGEVGKAKSVEASLYIVGREQEVISGNYNDGFVTFQLGDLASGWRKGDIAVVKVRVDGKEAQYEVRLCEDVAYKFTDNAERAHIPSEFALHANYPNPFNLATVIDYDLPRDTKVELYVTNVLGERIRTLVKGELSAGSYSVVWDGKDEKGSVMPSGVYYTLMRTPEFSSTKSMVLLK